MKKLLYLFMMIFIINACQTTDPKLPEPKIIPQDGKAYTYAQHNSNIAIRFNIQYFPPEYKTVQLIWGNAYHGYFDLNDIIYLPKLSGTQSLYARFSDVYGDIVYEETYHIEN